MIHSFLCDLIRKLAFLGIHYIRSTHHMASNLPNAKMMRSEDINARFASRDTNHKNYVFITLTRCWYWFSKFIRLLNTIKTSLLTNRRQFICHINHTEQRITPLIPEFMIHIDAKHNNVSKSAILFQMAKIPIKIKCNAKQAKMVGRIWISNANLLITLGINHFGEVHFRLPFRIDRTLNNVN